MNKQFQETRCAQPKWFKNLKFKKEVGITLKIRKQVASYLAKKLLTTHSAASTC